MRCEILIDRDMFKRGAAMLDAMIAAAPIPIEARERYVGDCELLMVYGTGHPIRRPWQQQHLANGGRLIAWDLGYWHRPEGAMRLSIDADHPAKLIERKADPSRWRAAGIELRADYKPNGHVLIVGIGPKSCKAYGLMPMQWELRRGKQALFETTGRRVIYKPKRPHDAPLRGFPVSRDDIATALRGCSLAVVRHSNVAIDACIAGVPVLCEDGAAVALYGDEFNFRNPRIPSVDERRAFLESLAWWNWKPTEAAQAWQYVLHRIKSG